METKYLLEQFEECEDYLIFEQLVRENDLHCRNWCKQLIPMLNCRGILKKDLMDICGKSKNTITSYTNEIPPREAVIHMAMGMHLTVDETNELLTRWANYAKLYSKDPRDTIWIYLLHRGGSKRPVPLFETYWKVYLDICESVHAGKCPKKAEIYDEQTRFLFERILASSQHDQMDASEDVFFRDMMIAHLPAFEQANHTLTEYIHSLYVPQVEYQMGRLTIQGRKQQTSRKVLSPRMLFQDHDRFRNAYYRKMERLKKYHTPPEREFLIALGLHLALDVKQIDKLLELAGMSPLHPKKRVDGTLIFYLEDLKSRYPAMFFADTEEVYLKTQELANEKMAEDTDVKNASALRKSERIYEYIKRRLEGTDIFKEEDRESLDKLLSFL